MKIWILAAVENELKLLLKTADARLSGRPGGFPWFEGAVGPNKINLGITGVGVAAAAMALGAFCKMEPPDVMVMVGSAGALPGSGLKTGDMVIADKEILAELGIPMAPGIGDAGGMGLCGIRQEISLDNEMSARLLDHAEKAGRTVHGPSLTVVGVSGDLRQARDRAAHFGALSENMEGYALALAGHRFGYRAVEIRGISNQAGDREKSRWDFDRANLAPQKALLEFLWKNY